MTSNPFTDLENKLDNLGKVIAGVATIVRSLAKPGAPAEEWEPIAVAMKRRRKSRKAIMAEVAAGHIDHRSEAYPGGLRYLLRIADLDRLFPVRA